LALSCLSPVGLFFCAQRRLLETAFQGAVLTTFISLPENAASAGNRHADQLGTVEARHRNAGCGASHSTRRLRLIL